MTTKIESKIFESKNEQFFKEYFELLLNRLTHSSMALEVDLGNPDISENAIRLKDNMTAFKYLLDSIYLGETLNLKLISDVASLVNNSAIYISNEYRKTGNNLNETDIQISSPENIEDNMKELISKYFNDWKEMDIFEREARFHIEFIKIHPFEDGNGRTSRLLLNFNLLRNGFAPVIITNDLLEFYHNYIRNNDVVGMRNLFYIQSIKENGVINQVYSSYDLEDIKDNKIK